MDVAVCSYFAGFIASMLVFIKAHSLRSLTFFVSLLLSACSVLTRCSVSKILVFNR